MNRLLTAKPTPWRYQRKGPIEKIDIDDKTIYYRSEHGFVTEMCLGERYIHVSPGVYFLNETYHGSYIDNWHGGIQTSSLRKAAEWISQAKHPEWGYDLWMIGGNDFDTLVRRIN